MKKAFYSDLDLTMIYSPRAIHKYHNNFYHTVVLEEHEDKPLSFMNLKSWQNLSYSSKKDFHFIPTTTRTFEQYSRIMFPQVKIDYAIVLNGAKIFHKDKEMKEWSSLVDKELDSLSITPHDFYKTYEKEIMKIPGVLKFRNASNYFTYVVKDEAENKEFDNFLIQCNIGDEYIISHQAKKSYIVPKNIDKGSTIKYLNELLNIDKSVGAGDSVLDLSMFSHVDAFIQPKHGEAVGTIPDAHITKKLGLDAGSEIVDFAIKFLK